MRFRPWDLRVSDSTTATQKQPDEPQSYAPRAQEPRISVVSIMPVTALQIVDVDMPDLTSVSGNRERGLQGVVLLLRGRLHHDFRVELLRNGMHRYCFPGLPLPDAGSARDALCALAR
jgi:hypothetical protein